MGAPLVLTVAPPDLDSLVRADSEPSSLSALTPPGRRRSKRIRWGIPTTTEEQSPMPLKHPKAPQGRPHDLAVQTVFTLEGDNSRGIGSATTELPPDVAYQIIHDELMLDGNARMNLATFVSTWMEPQAEKLMAECLDKNMIDKDEYPQTAELEMRCVNILSRLWNAPDAGEAVGCSTTGSSEAAMLGGLALKRLWQHRRKAEGKSTEKPNLVMGINVQVCWEKFANYWDVEMRLVPMEGDRFHLSAEEAVKLCDENTIGVVAILGSTFDGSYEPVEEICAALDDLQERTGLDIPVHVDGASGAFVAPFADPDLAWDFRLPRVASINASGHKYGLVYPGVGWIVWRDAEALPEDLIFWVNYLGDNMPTFALNFSRPGAQVVAQYYNFLRLGFDGYRKVQLYSRAVATRLADRIAALGPFELITRGRRAAGVRLQAQGRDRELHRLRRLELAAGARLAAARLHLPGEPHRPRGAAGGRQARLHPRHGRPAREGHRASAAAPRGAARAGARRLELGGIPPLSRRAQRVGRAAGRAPAPSRSTGRGRSSRAPSTSSTASSTSGALAPQRKRVLAGGARPVAWRTRSWWIAVLFMVGSACFALGAVPGYVRSSGSAQTASRSSSARSSSRARRRSSTSRSSTPRRRRPAARADRASSRGSRGRIDWLATSIQLVGTVFFNISTFRAMLESLDDASANLLSWRPTRSARSASSSRAGSPSPRRGTAGSRGGRAISAG